MIFKVITDAKISIADKERTIPVSFELVCDDIAAASSLADKLKKQAKFSFSHNNSIRTIGREHNVTNPNEVRFCGLKYAPESIQKVLVYDEARSVHVHYDDKTDCVSVWGSDRDASRFYNDVAKFMEQLTSKKR